MWFLLLVDIFLGFKLIKQVMKVLECIVEVLIRLRVGIIEMQFGSMPCLSAPGVIFILGQIPMSPPLTNALTLSLLAGTFVVS